MESSSKKVVSLSHQAFLRMPYYLKCLNQFKEDGIEAVSASSVAEILGLKEVQVRKDFASVSSTKGLPKKGFIIDGLIADMENCLGYHNLDQVVLVGLGSLGKALISYKGFAQYGLDIVMAFDNSEELIGQKICGKYVQSTNNLSETCRRMNIKIGIIAVPDTQAQIICDQLVAGGVLAIWNFAPVHLSAPAHILLQNENLASSLALLAKRLEIQLQFNE